MRTRNKIIINCAKTLRSTRLTLPLEQKKYSFMTSATLSTRSLITSPLLLSVEASYFLSKNTLRLLLFMLLLTLYPMPHVCAQDYYESGQNNGYYEEEEESEDEYLKESFLYAQTVLDASYYVAQVTTDVNLRAGRGTDYDIITTIPKGSNVFLTSVDYDYKFRNVLFIADDLFGYISSSYLTNFRKVKVDESGNLQIEGPNYKETSDIVIENQSDRYATISVGKWTTTFAPHETKTLTDLRPGRYKVMASSKEVIPYISYDIVKGGYKYSWYFFIKTIYK